jgi:hypothetical protein
MKRRNDMKPKGIELEGMKLEGIKPKTDQKNRLR